MSYNMKIKLCILSIALLAALSIFLSGIASAAVAINIQSPITVNHNSDNTISFTLNNTGSESYGSLNIDGSTTQIGQWKQLSPITIAATQVNQQFSAVLSVPKDASGSFTSVLKINNGTTNLLSKSLTFNIANAPSLILTKTQELSETQNGKVEVKNDGNVELSVKLNVTGDFSATLSDNNFVLAPGNSKIVTVTPGDLTELKFGTYSIIVTGSDSVKGVESKATFTHTKSFCKSGEAGSNLTISKVSIDNTGDKNEEWKLLDIIDIDVRVDNDGNDDIKDVIVELGLFDSEGKNQVGDLEFENTDEDSISIGKIRDGDDSTVTFRFKVPADFEDGSYKLAVKAYSDDLGESVECVGESDDLSDDFYEQIDVIREDDTGKFIAFDNIQVMPSSDITCGDSVSVTFDVFNVGDEDQDQIRINLFSSELNNLKLEREIREDLDVGDKQKVSFDFIIPNGLQDRLYRLQLSADYDYRNSNYRESSDESTEFTINVKGCSAVPSGTERIALIAASLDSDAEAGKELQIKLIITGLISGEADYVVVPTDFESWAELNSISERLVHLRNGESKEVTLRLNVNKDVSDEQSLIIEVRSGDKLETREVSVNIAAEAQTGGLNLGGNNLIWIIGAINVVLIVLIIIVATRISRK